MRQGRMTRGFTLIELMVTALIVLTAICGLLLAIYNRVALDGLNKHRVIAVNDAQSCLEEIKALSYDNIISSYNCSCENDSVTVTGQGTNLKMVTVVINRPWRQKNESFSVSTLIAK